MGRTDCAMKPTMFRHKPAITKFGQHGTLPPRMCLKRENILKGGREGGGRLFFARGGEK